MPMIYLFFFYHIGVMNGEMVGTITPTTFKTNTCNSTQDALLSLIVMTSGDSSGDF